MTLPRSPGGSSSPHYKSRGFWFTLGTFVVSGLVLTGVLQPESEGEFTSMTHHVIQSITWIISVGSGYWYARTRQKQEDEVLIEDALHTPVPRRRRKRSTKPVSKTARKPPSNKK